jgi:hypothetical protein
VGGAWAVWGSWVDGAEACLLLVRYGRLVGRRLSFALVIVVFAAAGSGIAVAGSSRGARAITQLADQKQLTSYELGTDAAGAATVMWTTLKLVGPEHETAAVIRVRQQDATGRWRQVVPVGGVTQTNEAQLMVSASGAAAIVWCFVRGGSHSATVLMVSTRASEQGSWSAPRRIWSGTGAGGLQLVSSINASGTLTVAWAGYGRADPAIWVASVDAANDRVGRRERVAAPGSGGTNLGLAENGSGAAVLSWQRQLRSTGHGAIEPFSEMAAWQPTSGARWSTARQLGRFSIPREPVSSTVWTPTSPSSVVTADGTAAVGWRAGDGGHGMPLKVSIRRPGQARWSAAHTLTHDLAGFGLTAAHNTPIAVWSSDTARQDTLRIATSASGFHWSAPARLVRIPGGTLGPILASANGLIALVPLTGNHAPIQYLTRSTQGRWSAPRRVGTGDNPEVALSSHGKVAVLWENFNHHGRYTLQISSQH